MFKSQFVICPVCKTKLGRKTRAMDLEVFDCAECKAFINIDKEMNVKMMLYTEADLKKKVVYCSKDGCHCH